MKLSIGNWVAAFTVAVLLSAVLALVGKPVLAQVDASSSPEEGTSTAVETTQQNDASTTADTTSSTDETTAAASTETTSTTETTRAAVTPTEAPPAGLTEVHIIGTKYTDYFTDGTTITAYPGDPAIDAHLAEKDAPIPTHEGLTWVHTTGSYSYDTASRDLEEGQYAVQPDNSYIAKPFPFVSSTSTPAVAEQNSAPTSPSEPTATPTDTPTDSTTSTPTTDTVPAEQATTSGQ